MGFIEYLPSYNPYSGSEVIIHDLSDRKAEAIHNQNIKIIVSTI